MENIEMCILLGFRGNDNLSIVLNFSCILDKNYIYNKIHDKKLWFFSSW